MLVLTRTLKSKRGFVHAGSKLQYVDTGVVKSGDMYLHTSCIPVSAIAAEAVSLSPADIPNTLNVMKDNEIVARIFSKNLTGQSYDEDSASILSTNYDNKDDNKLYIKDNADNDIDLPCLRKDTVVGVDLLNELEDYFAGVENVSHAMFDDYDYATGKAYAGMLKVLYISDLYDLVQELSASDGKYATIAFGQNKVVSIQHGCTINIDFNTMKFEILDASDEQSAYLHNWLTTHFNKNLQPAKGVAKPEIATEQYCGVTMDNKELSDNFRNSIAKYLVDIAKVDVFSDDSVIYANVITGKTVSYEVLAKLMSVTGADDIIAAPAGDKIQLTFKNICNAHSSL